MSNAHGHHWITDKRRKAIYGRDGFACVYCGHDERKKLTLDHLTPRSLGGTHASTNLVTACIGCNSRRRHSTLRAFFVILRAMGIDTKGLGWRIRRQVARPCVEVTGRGPAPVVVMGPEPFVPGYCFGSTDWRPGDF